MTATAIVVPVSSAYEGIADDVPSRIPRPRLRPPSPAASLAVEVLVSHAPPIPTHLRLCCKVLWLTRKGVGHALRRNAAGAFGPDLAKKLSQLVKMEKNVMRSMETVAKERMEVAVSFLAARSASITGGRLC